MSQTSYHNKPLVTLRGYQYESSDTYPPQPPSRKKMKWSPEEDASIIELRGNGMKWDDISKQLPGRSSSSCRLHYQNYLERRSEWDEDRKNKLARLYDRFKAEMWAKVAEELQVPWRAAEAMHWQLGEFDMAERAGGTPFTLITQSRGQTDSPPKGSRDGSIRPVLPYEECRRSTHKPLGSMTRPKITIASGPPTMDLAHVTSNGRKQQQPTPLDDYAYKPNYDLPPIQHLPRVQNSRPLPGVAELTAGTTAYSTPPLYKSRSSPLRLQNNHLNMLQKHGHQRQVAPICAEPDHNRKKRPGIPKQQEGSNLRRRLNNSFDESPFFTAMGSESANRLPPDRGHSLPQGPCYF